MTKKSFTKKQQELFCEVFTIFDTNNDGKVSSTYNFWCWLKIEILQIEQSELINVMGRLGVEVSKKDIEDRMLEFDLDKNGTIDYSEVDFEYF